jgi:hypothetical protein
VRPWILAIALGALLGCTPKSEPPVSTFDSKTWKDPELINQDPYPRRDMADELVGRRTLVGKSRAEVLEMLGEAPKSEYFTDWDVVYWLGPQRGFVAVDSEWLVIRFDESDRVTEAKITTD